MAAGWNVTDASTLGNDRSFEADVVVIGSGAGGGVTAEILALAGLKVLIVEEGGLKSSQDFKMREAQAYPALYQESAARKTRDKAINILQGRTVGGSTTVNWTSSFRTPPGTLEYWRKHFGLSGYGVDAMAPWFAMMEKRLHVSDWAAPPNENNDLLRRGATALGIPTAAIRRNVNGCWNLGYCGMGCPTNAKQSMLVTTIPATLDKGGELLYLARAEKLLIEGDKVTGIQCLGLDERCVAPTGRKILVKARHYVLAGGGINTPGLLLRSDAPDPHGRTGKRTFLHVVNFSAAQFERLINPFYGAPQSIYSDHFQWDDGATGRMSYKLEVPPLQPSITATLLGRFGIDNALRMEQLPHTNVMLALMRDGFHPDSAEGTVELRGDGSPVLDYRMTDYTWDGIRRAFQVMAEIQFAAGARAVLPMHADADYVKTLGEARSLIDGLPLELYRARLGSAHVMGGCAMGEDPKQAVTDSLGRHHQLANLSIHDGSLFPTSIGANPQLSIYGLTAKLASALAERLGQA
ncbi:6'''-hydroxyparomomycin C oxidase [compost metagenome]